MNFVSVPFLIFAAAFLLLFFLVPARWKWAWLLVASYVFYGFAGATAVLLLAASTALVYAAGLGLEKAVLPGRRRLVLVLGLTAALGGLVVFKYTDFFGRLAFAAAGLVDPGIAFKPVGLVYIAGLSFYSFKLASYLIDVYRKRLPAERHLGYFALYAAYFPQLLMGPIDRAVRFLPELKKRVVPDLDRTIAGIERIAWGVFKKIAVADRLAFFVNDMFAQPAHKGIYILFGAYLYAFQIYFDFSGYTDIAVGLSRIMGYESAENFRAPYASRGIPEFWSRWHITLSSWLRDYLFLPVAYKVMRGIESPRRLGIKAEAWAYGIGIMVTWALGGLWHGAAWTFVTFGLIHGFYLLVSNAAKKPRRRLVRRLGLGRHPRLHHAIQLVITFNLVSLAWVFFRAESVPAALNYLKQFSRRIPDSGGGLLLFSILLIAAVIGLEALFQRPGGRGLWRSLPSPLRIAAFALGICLIAILAVSTGNEFLYFRF